MNSQKPRRTGSETQWVPIPDGIRVRHRVEGHEGVIDGLTELGKSLSLNPDGKTQYRINVGMPDRKLAAEDDLLLIADQEGLVMMLKQPAEYRRYVTERLRCIFSEDRFVASITSATQKKKSA